MSKQFILQLTKQKQSSRTGSQNMNPTFYFG